MSRDPRVEIDVADTSDPAKSEPILDILDTYHDFCKGERAKKKKKKEGGEEKEEEVVDKRVDIMRTYLPLLLAKTYTNFDDDGGDYTKNVKTISNNVITSVSKIEHQTIELFEEKYKDQIDAHPDTSEIITMEEIITAYNKGKGFDENTTPLWKRFKTNEANRSLEIQKDGKDDLSVDDCNALANFILNYFFFSSGEKDVHVTFDAAEGTVGEIFRDQVSVKNIIFPQTIADSATTSLDVLKGRCDYIFPSDSDEIDFRSNEFSSRDYRIYFKNNPTAPFGNMNPYGFSIIIELKSDKSKKVEIPFSSTQTEGPSVNYIIDILNTLQLAKNDSVKLQKIPKKSSIVNLGLALDKYPPLKRQLFTGIKNKTNGILPDLKRGGDHEAVNATQYVIRSKYTNTIFTTIDMLCALKARKEKINCIWQTSERLVLYRFPTVEDKDRDKYSFIIKAQDSLELIDKINVLLTKRKKTEDSGPSPLEEELTKQLEEAEKALNGVYDAKGTNVKCKQVLNALLRMRMLDLKTYINANKTLSVPTKVENFFSNAQKELAIMRGKTKKELLAKITEEEGTFVYKEGAKSITLIKTEEYQGKLNTLFQDLIAGLKKKINVDINLSEENIANKLKINKPLTKEQRTAIVFLPTDHSVFNYLTGPFVRFYEMMVLVEELVVTEPRRRDFPIKLKKFLQNDRTNEYNYFGIVEEILEQFKTEEIKNKLSDILEFTDTALDEAAKASRTSGVMEKDLYLQHYFIGKSTEPKIKGVLDSVLDYYTQLSTETGTGRGRKPALLPPISILAGGGPKVQSGGATGEYYELSDLLFSISTKAAAYIESAFSKKYTFYTLERQILYLNKVWQYIRKYGQQSLYNMPYCINLFKTILQYHHVLTQDTTYNEFVNSLPSTIAETPKVKISQLWSLVYAYRNTFGDYDIEKNKQNYTVAVLTNVNNTKPLKQMNSLINHLNTWLNYVIEKNIKTTFKFPSLNDLFAYLKTDEFNVPVDESEHIYLDVAEPAMTIPEGPILTSNTPEPLPSTKYEAGTHLINGAQKLLNELQEEWEYKLAELRKVQGYEFPTSATFGTENFFTAFLALENHEGTLVESYLLNVNKPNEEKLLERGSPYGEFKSIKDPIPSQDDLSLYKLFLLTFLENIQNEHKYSFFLDENYKNRYFDSKGDWNNKLGGEVLPMLIQKLKGDASIPLKYDITSITYGGSRKYPKKTRKAKQKPTRKSHKKTMRVKKH